MSITSYGSEMYSNWCANIYVKLGMLFHFSVKDYITYVLEFKIN